MRPDPQQRALSGTSYDKKTSLMVVFILGVIIVVAATGSLYVLSRARASHSSNCATITPAVVPRTIPVSIYDGAFNPNDPPGYYPDRIVLVIGVNNTVIWTNNDTAAHTVTSSIAPQCGTFSSGNLNPGDTYTRTFTSVGTYQYYCVYHHWMMGTIVVKS